MIIQSKRVWIGGQFMAAQLKVEDGKIKQVYPWGTLPADEDYENKRIVPGFIDVHTHGAYGFDTNDAEEEGLRRTGAAVFVSSPVPGTGSGTGAVGDDLVRGFLRGDPVYPLSPVCWRKGDQGQGRGTQTAPGPCGGDRHPGGGKRPAE